MKSLKEIEKILKQKQFTASRFLSNRHVQTIIGVIGLRKLNKDIPHKKRLFTMDDGDKISTDISWQRNRLKHKTLVIIHGLTGSSKAHYVQGVASKGFDEDYNIVHINLRNAGGTENLTRKLFHSGQSEDINCVVKELIRKDKLPSIVILGFSLSGNICLKLLGEWHSKYPKQVKALAVVSPLIDLKASEPYMNKKENRFYRSRLMKTLKALIISKSKYYPEYETKPLKNISTFREFDDYYHSMHSGFKGADDYYSKASSIKLIPKIKIPTLIIHSEDDSIVPIAPLRKSKANKNPNMINAITICFKLNGIFLSFISKAIPRTKSPTTE